MLDFGVLMDKNVLEIQGRACRFPYNVRGGGAQGKTHSTDITKSSICKDKGVSKKATMVIPTSDGAER